MKVLVLSRLLVESGYLSQPDLRVALAENISEIEIDDGETVIRGRMNAIVCRNTARDRTSLCILVIETKNSAVNVMQGLPQLLVYMQSFLDEQTVVWELVTNGSDYSFVRLEPGVFRLFKTLSLLFPEDAAQILQVAIALAET